LICNGAPLFP